MAESGEDLHTSAIMCNLSPRLYALSEQLGIGYQKRYIMGIFPDPGSELETPAKDRWEKQTSEHRVSVFFY
jgi:hypothetical protein